MAAETGSSITVFYDGLCPVCSREVAVYRRLDRTGRIVWRDLAGPGDPLRGARFTLDAALRLLHATDAAGALHVGLDAHLLMWRALPGWRGIAALLGRWPALRPPVQALYLAFTARRPGWVQRRRAEVDHG